MSESAKALYVASLAACLLLLAYAAIVFYVPEDTDMVTAGFVMGGIVALFLFLAAMFSATNMWASGKKKTMLPRVFSYLACVQLIVSTLFTFHMPLANMFSALLALTVVAFVAAIVIKQNSQYFE